VAEPINLTKARKARAKAADQARAAENRVKFGRTSAEKTLDAARTDLARHKLDQTRRERE
jgi:Domain of unknown function (DUF4169)